MFSPLKQHIFSLHLCCDTIEQLILIEESAAKTSDEGVTPGTIDYADPKWVGLIDRGARNDSWEKSYHFHGWTQNMCKTINPRFYERFMEWDSEKS